MKAESSFPLELLCTALGLGAPQGAPGSFPAITTDSRKISPGCLFIAIPGDKFDGHSFLGEALSKGAGAVLCRKGSPLPPRAVAFEVEDTVEAYRRIGAAWRQRFQGPVCLVAGSVGKTSTKEILSALLRGRWPEVLRTSGSQNGFVGIPMTLLEIDPARHGAAVIEVGIDEIGAMAQHLRVVAATAGLLTPIAPEHLEKLIDLPTVAREEALALQEIDARRGLTAVSLDDPWLKELVAETPQGERFYFSMRGAKAPQGREDRVLRGNLAETGATLQLTGGPLKAPLVLTLPLPGEHNALNLLAASTLALGLGLTPAQLEAGLRTFTGAAGRSELRRLPAGNTVICDYYNASPASVDAGLALLERSARGGRRVACLGDMLELGTAELDYHRALAEPLGARSVERVFLYGPRMRALQAELEARQKQGRFHGTSTHHDSHEDLARQLAQELRTGDTLLIKGSRGMRMEEVWKRIEHHDGTATR